jgi:hypothetical protein
VLGLSLTPRTGYGQNDRGFAAIVRDGVSDVEEGSEASLGSLAGIKDSDLDAAYLLDPDRSNALVTT